MQRALEKIESPVEGGERPLYSADIQNIIAAYAVDGSSEAMLRKFMVDVAWLSGGRVRCLTLFGKACWYGSPTCLHRTRRLLDDSAASLQIDSQDQVVYTGAVQVNVSVMKTVVFAAGFNRRFCTLQAGCLPRRSHRVGPPR